MATTTLNTTPTTNGDISTTLVEPSGVQQNFESATNLSFKEQFVSLKEQFVNLKNEITALCEDFAKKKARYYHLMNEEIPRLKNYINGCREMVKEQEALKVRDEIKIKEQEMALEKKTPNLECNHRLIRDFTVVIQNCTLEVQKYEEELEFFRTHICLTYLRNFEALLDRYNSLASQSNFVNESIQEERESIQEELNQIRNQRVQNVQQSPST